MLSGAFAGMAAAFARAGIGPYTDAVVHTSTPPVLDDGGSIVTAGQQVRRTCQAQVDRATDAMRRDAGFVQGDVLLLVLAATLDGGLDTDAEVEVLGSTMPGRYSIQAVTRDTAGIGWECRGRRL